MIQNLFAEPIYHALDVISEEENQKLIDECYRLSKVTQNGAACWDCEIYTSFTSESLSENLVFDVLTNATQEHIDKFREEVGFQAPLSSAYSWFNIASPGDYQEQHTHQGYWFSSIYYMKVPEGAGVTRFKSPYENQMGEVFGMDSPYNKMHTVEPVERSLVIFGSHLPHWVPRGRTMEDRITVAGNWS